MDVSIEKLRQDVAAGERAKEASAEREVRIANCELESTDAFLSIWAEGLTRHKGELAKSLIEAGGEAYFWRWELVNAETGEKVQSAKLFDGQYGESWVIKDAAEQVGASKFVTAHAKREATMVGKGYRERVVIFRAAAKADITASGTGLSGAHTARAVIAVDQSTTAEYTVWHGIAGLSREDAEEWVERQRADSEFGYIRWQEVVFEGE